MSREDWKSRDNNAKSKSTIFVPLFSTLLKGYATSSLITRFISQDVSINPEIWYLPDCNHKYQHRAACTAKARAGNSFSP